MKRTLLLDDPEVPSSAIQIAAKHHGLDEFSPTLSNAIEADNPTKSQINSLRNRLSAMGWSKISFDSEEEGPFYSYDYGKLLK